MAQTIVGIDLGSYSIKVSQLERSLRDFELVSFHEQVISTGTRLTLEESQAAALRLVIEKNRIPLDSVSINFPAHHLSCRVLELPFTNAKKIEATLDFELENFVPLPLEELMIDYHILSIEENRSTVLTAYVSQTRFIKYLDLLQTAGVDPRFVGVDAIDLAHIAQISLVPQQGVYAILDIGHEKTNICVMDGMKLQYVRSVTVGGIHFTKAIQKAFRLNAEKAEGLKLDRGRVSYAVDGLDQISRILNSVAEELLAFVRQTYMGYKQLYVSQPWTAIYLCGGGSKLPGLSDMISNSLRLNVAPLECLDLIQHRLENPDECRETIAPSLSQTVKIMYSNKAIKINFRRGEFAYQRDIKALGSEIKQAAIWFSLVFMLGFSHFLFSYFSLQWRIQKADAALVSGVVKAFPELKAQSNSGSKKLMTAIASHMTEIQTELEALNPASQTSALGLLLEISQKIPAKENVTIDIDDFNFTGDHITIEGRTDSFQAVDKIRDALAASPLFKKVTANPSKGVRDEIKFSLSMDVVTTKPGDKES